MGDASSLGARSPKGWPEFLEEGGAWCQFFTAPHARLVDLSRLLPIPTDGDSLFDVFLVCCPLEDAKGNGTPPQVFLSLLHGVAVKAVRMSNRVVILPPLPIHAHPGQPRGFGRPARRWQSRVAEAVLKESWGERITALPWGVEAEMTIDGIHPSLRGHEALAAQVRRGL